MRPLRLKPRNKYRARPSRYGDAVYHSALEARVAARLDSLRGARQRKERVANVQRQVPVPLVVNGSLVATWKVDFLVTYADGREVYVEAKGFETSDYRIKRKLFEALYPDRILEVITHA